ncbi:MAG: hypothetical protein ACREOD_05955 [Candidatus Dormibacteria bacterium]
MSCDPNRANGWTSLVPLACSPPRLAADTRGKRIIDRLQPTGVGQWVFFAVVAVSVSVAPSLPVRPGLAVDLVATVAASAWCLGNFWRCREAHCIVTGLGWAALAGLEVAEIVLGHSIISGDEGRAFVAILVIAMIFQCVWRTCCGTNALIHQRP